MKYVGLFIYPWDLADEGIDVVLDKVKGLGVTRIYLAALYHAGYFLHPHNPRRKSFLLEDGVAYFRPRFGLYGGALTPRVSRMCDQKDWVAAASEGCRARGMELSAWTVYLHNTALGRVHPECTVRNVYGDSYPHALSPAHPDVQAYAKAVTRDLSERYGLSSIMVEAANYRGRKHGGGWVAGHHHERTGVTLRPLEEALFDMSFNPVDVKRAGQAGVDMKRLRHTVRRHLDTYLTSFPELPPGLPRHWDEFAARHPEAAAYRRYQKAVESELLLAMAETAAPYGVDLDGPVDPAVKTILAGVYGQSVAEVAETLRGAKGAAGGGQDVTALIRLGFTDVAYGTGIHSASDLALVTQTAKRAGADAIAFYNYGEAPEQSVTWIRDAVDRLEGVDQLKGGDQHKEVDHLKGVDRLKAGAAGTSAAGRAAAGRAATLGVGLIGCGSFAEHHVRGYRLTPEFTVHACTDRDLGVARAFADRTNIEHVSETADALLERPEVQAVSIVVPHAFHLPLFERAIHAGKHIWIEKPPGVSLAEADRMLDLSTQTDRVVTVGLIHRYAPGYRALKALVDAGAVGKVLSVKASLGRHMYTDPRWRRPATTPGGWFTQVDLAGGGVLPSASIHTLSAILYVLGEGESVVESVSAAIDSIHPGAYPGIEDDVTLRASLRTGASLTVSDSWAHTMPFGLSVLGTDGYITLSRSPATPDVAGEISGAVPDAFKRFVDADRLELSHEQIANRYLPGCYGLAADFAQAVSGRGRPDELPTLRHARNLRAVLDACYRSARSEESEVRVDWR